MTEPTIKVGKTDVFKVPVSMFRTKEGFNVRTDYGDMDGLIASIRENGVRMPVRGYKVPGESIYYVTDGHRRLAACQALEAQGVSVFIPFMPEPQKYSDEQRLFDMFITAEGKALTPLEQANGIQRLLAYGYDTKEIATKLGKSDTYINRLNALGKAPKKFLNLVEQGIVSGSYAMKIVGDKGVDAFMEKYETGGFDQNQGSNGEEINELFEKPVPSPAKPAKITQKDVQTLNSMKEFKRITSKLERDEVSEEKGVILDFVWALLNNNMTTEQIETFFK